MGSLANALDIVNLVLFSAVAVVALLQWRAGRGRAALWAALTFIDLAVIVDVANALPEDPTSTPDLVLQRGVILGLVLWDTPEARLGAATLAFVGVLFAIYLLVVQLFVIDAVCVWCMANDVLIAPALAVVTALRLRT